MPPLASRTHLSRGEPPSPPDPSGPVPYSHPQYSWDHFPPGTAEPLLAGCRDYSSFRVLPPPNTPLFTLLPTPAVPVLPEVGSRGGVWVVMIPEQVHLEPHLWLSRVLPGCPRAGALDIHPLSQLQCGCPRRWRCGRDLIKPSQALPGFGGGGHSLPLASPEFGSLPELMGLGQMWMEQALIHGLSHLPSVPEAWASHWSSHFPLKPRSRGSERSLSLHCM